MGYHNLLPSYDTWRTTPPDQLRKPSPFFPSDVTKPLLIEADDIQIDAYGTYDADTGSLNSVRINGREISPEAVTQALGLLGEVGNPCLYELDEHELADLINEAAQDAADDYGDYRYEQSRDDY